MERYNIGKNSAPDWSRIQIAGQCTRWFRKISICNANFIFDKILFWIEKRPSRTPSQGKNFDSRLPVDFRSTFGRRLVKLIFRNWKIFMTITTMLITNFLTIIRSPMNSQLMSLERIMLKILLTCMSLDNRSILTIFHSLSMKAFSLQFCHRNLMPRNCSFPVDIFPVSGLINVIFVTKNLSYCTFFGPQNWIDSCSSIRMSYSEIYYNNHE